MMHYYFKVKDVLLLLLLVTVPISLQAQIDSSFSSPQNANIAPGLHNARWIKGSPVYDFMDDHIYIVEFTATWCAPCRKMIPHLSALSQKYPDQISVISVYIWQNDSPGEDSSYYETVQKFVDQLGDRITFKVATDNPGQTIASNWGMKNQTGKSVPNSFIVNRNKKIIWEGHPMELDSLVPALLSGKMSEYMAKTVSVDEQNKVLLSLLKMKYAGDYLSALKGIDSLIRIYPTKYYLHAVKFNILAGNDDKQANEVLRNLLLIVPDSEPFDWDHLVSNAFNLPPKPDYDLALQIAERAVAKAETNGVRANISYNIFRILLRKGNFPEAKKAYEKTLQYSELGENPEKTIEFKKRMDKQKAKYGAL